MIRRFHVVVGSLMFCAGVMLGFVTFMIFERLRWETLQWELHPSGAGFMRMTGLDFGVFNVPENWLGGFTAALAALSIVFLWLGIRFIITGRFFRRV